MTLSEIKELYTEEDFLIADGFDDSVVGVEPLTMRLIYDMNKMIETLISQGMSYEDAIEYLEFNTWTAYVGEKTPIYVNI